MRRFCSRFAAAGVGLAIACAPTPSDAAERYIDRSMTQHRLVFAGDVGLGIAHIDNGGPGTTGAGFNLEGAFGVTETVELGLRTGVGFDNAGKGTRADAAGRTLWTETYGTGGDAFSNPELRVRWVFYTGSVAEVGLDGRMYLPFAQFSSFGMMIGIPLAFHVSDILRIDTGAYVPMIFSDPTFAGVSIPGYFWFQPSDRFWIGPMTAMRFHAPAPIIRNHDAHLLLGVGLGYQVANAVDLKAMFLFPTIDADPGQNFGFGFGVQFRIGD
jgi:hypothetical protein